MVEAISPFYVRLATLLNMFEGKQKDKTVAHTLLLSNLGYARGFNGELAHHIRYAHRYLFCSEQVQRVVLEQLQALIAQVDPDICCLVEIDSSTLRGSNFQQLEALLDDDFPYFDIENKYGKSSILRSLIFTKGKSNAYVAKKNYPHEKIYFDYGTKRLIYKIELEPELTLFFSHYSLNKAVRRRQLEQTRRLMEETQGDVVFLGDFNVLGGLGELSELLEDGELVLLNKEDAPTFTFHRRRLVLDLCLCSKPLAERMELQVVPQPYSDHAALVATIYNR